MEIEYIKGDATNPIGEGNKIIAHICNDIGKWGKGFVMALSKKWESPKSEYISWFEKKGILNLGEVQFVQVEENIWVANMIGQHRIRKGVNGTAPIRYQAVEIALQKVAEEAFKANASVHMPRIGTGLAGGKWEEIELLIEKTLLVKGIQTIVYDL